MVAYLKKVRKLLATFKKYEICQIPWSQNSHTDALDHLATTRDIEFLWAVPVEFLATPSTDQQVEMLAIDVPQDLWMNPILNYLQNGGLPEDKLEARRLQVRLARYYFYNDKLYKKGFSVPLLRCINGIDCQVILKEIHAGQCGNHTGELSLVEKALR